jgi:hypothetical protein
MLPTMPAVAIEVKSAIVSAKVFNILFPFIIIYQINYYDKYF